MILVVDSYSKWIEAFPTKSSISAAIIDLSRLRLIIFVSEEFENFLLKYSIKHNMTSAPHVPSTNGLAEQTVQIVKQGFNNDGLLYLTTEYKTGESPAQSVRIGFAQKFGRNKHEEHCQQK